MSQRITQQQLESYLWGAATLLRGTIDAGDYKQFIFPLLFYKRICDVFDEETQAALKESGSDKDFAAYRENHRFQIPSEAHWRNVRQAAKNVGKALQSAMRTIETANPDKLYGIFGDAQWTNKDRLSDAMLRDLVEHFSTLELAVANLPEDELGQGYEYLIKKFADDAALALFFKASDDALFVRTNLQRTVRDFIERRMATRPENVRLDLREDLEAASVLANGELVTSILENLTLNAIEAMPSGGLLSVAVTYKIRDSMLEIQVADTGVGISAEAIPGLFTNLKSSKAKGMGLGLATVKQIVDRHCGLVGVESKSGAGTKFTVLLPLEKAS